MNPGLFGFKAQLLNHLAQLPGRVDEDGKREGYTGAGVQPERLWRAILDAVLVSTSFVLKLEGLMGNFRQTNQARLPVVCPPRRPFCNANRVCPHRIRILCVYTKPLNKNYILLQFLNTTLPLS